MLQIKLARVLVNIDNFHLLVYPDSHKQVGGNMPQDFHSKICGGRYIYILFNFLSVIMTIPLMRLILDHFFNGQTGQFLNCLWFKSVQVWESTVGCSASASTMETRSIQGGTVISNMTQGCRKLRCPLENI